MIGFLYKRKLKRDVEKLEDKLITSLKGIFPDLAENHDHWNLSTMTLFGEVEKSIQLLHSSMDLDYVTKNKAKHKKNLRIEGIEILNKQSGKFVPLKLLIYGNLIQYIYLQFNKVISKEFDFESIRINNLNTETLSIENPDEKTLRKILAKLPKNKLEQIEIADTFEIELNDSFYYTIFDLEDGNYIAVDKHGIVYRLIHDHENPVKKIADSVDLIFDSYTGNKKELEKYMDK